MVSVERLPAAACRWRCDPDSLGFETTAELESPGKILGQEEAVEALSFGLKNRFRGNNIFVRGLSGFGRMALIHQAIRDIANGLSVVPDYAYVCNFDEPSKPRLLSLPAGRGREFCQAMEEFATFVETELPAYLNSDLVKSRQKQLIESAQVNLKQLGEPLDTKLTEAGLTLIPMQVGQNMVPMILPVIEGKAVGFDELQKMRLEGRMPEEDFKALTEKISSFEQELAALGEQFTTVQLQLEESVRQLFADEATHYVEKRLGLIKSRFVLPEVTGFLDEILHDLITRRLHSESIDFAALYRVNLVSSRGAREQAPVISVANPTLINLVGTIDGDIIPGTNLTRSDHLSIKPGALLDANGGFLIMEAREIISEPGAWSVLLRTLRSGMFELTQLDPFGMWNVGRLKPEPIPVDIKVILVGDPETHYLLDQYEPRFANLFKVLADFNDTIKRDASGFDAYSRVLARLAESDGLKPFRKDAVAMLIEHGARICSQGDRLTSRFGRISDVAREASFIAGENAHSEVQAEDVILSIQHSRDRANLPSRRFQRLIADSTILIDVKGEVIGQVNGLAVTSAGPLVYGFPTRITATIGPGHAGVINIERESDLSGSIHTKGFMILSGLFRHVLRLDHPMAFSSSIAFEQSYGGIDGDSASGAEFCCLLSALTNTALRQDLAMTGAIDQKGHILPIGAVTEKVEGYYDACCSLGLTGTQGVIIPRSNSDELMLRLDVVDAIDQGRFHVYPVSRIEQAVELFMGIPFGDLDNPEAGSVLAVARQKAHDYWKSAMKHGGEE